MAIGWFSVLSKVIPWGDVVDAAPQIVKGAKRLFRSVKNNSAETVSETESAAFEPEDPTGLNIRVRRLQAKISEMETEQQASAALIQSLAEQNAFVIKAVEVMRTRTKVLIYAFAAIVIAFVALVVWIALKHG
jgi:hypothetical protein